MSDSKVELNCVNCGASEMEVPLISARYDGGQHWICSGCLPILIHKPEQLVGTLRGINHSQAAADHH